MATKILPSADNTDQIGQSTANGDDSNLRWKGIFSDVRVEGDLTVTGSTTTVSTTNTTISDKIIELASGTTGDPAATDDKGIIIDRGDDSNAAIIWDESAERFHLGTTSANGDSTGAITVSTGTLVADLGSDSTLTSVKVATGVNDSNGNELLSVTAVDSAVNHLEVANSATGGNPSLTASGDDSNIGIDFQLKGTGSFDVHGTSATSAQIKLYEDTDDGSNYIGLKAATIDASYTLTFPTGVPASNGLSLVANTDGTCSWNSVSAGGLADNSVGFSKLADIDGFSVIGNVTTSVGTDGNPEEVRILDEDNMSSNSATSLATQQSIKAYVDSQTTDLASEVTGTLAISNGGTGATTAAAARTALDVDQAGTDNSTDVSLATVANNYLSISGQEITAGTVPVSLGGTGATTAAAARTALDVDQAGTDNSTDVTLASVTGNYLSISGQEITSGTVPLSLGGTGATTAAAARTALGVDAAGTDNSTNVTLANTNYLSISGQEITGGTVPVSSGGTGATTAAAARTALDVDQAGTDNSTDVTLASVSGNYLSIDNQEITAGTVPVSLGGTGATTAAAARTALDVDQAGTDNSTDVTLASVTDNYLSISGQEITVSTVPVSLGGTGATTAAAARTALGVDQAGTDNSTDVSLATVADNYLSISGQEITVSTVPVSLGGTGATTAAAARTALGVDAAGTDNSTNVTLANTNYLSISGQEITGGTVPVSSGGTGATTAAAARTALDVDQAGTDNSTDVTLASVSGNFLSLSGQEITVSTVPVSLGGTGATTAAAARTALDVDQAGTDNSTNVTLANTNYLSISGQEITGGTVPVASGGTGSTTASDARAALGLAIGSDVQAYDSSLADIASNLTATAAELNYNDITTPGTTQASRVVTTDSNGDISALNGSITITGSGNGITINNGDLNVTGDAQISGGLQVNDKLNLSGSVATIGATTLKMDDSLIELNYLGADASSTKDLGLFGRTIDSGTDTYQGLVFDGSDDIWKFFSTTSYPGADNYISGMSNSKLQVDTVLVKRSVPSSSVGASGDKQGMIAFDGGHLYLCSADYDGTSNVWKRIQLSSDTW